MTLRGEIDAFPLETVVQLIHSTSKTGQLEVRASDSTGGTLGFDGGRLVAAISGDDVGEPALGAVFAVSQGAFEFIPWTDAPAANLSGDLDQLLDKAVEERDRIVAIRAIIPNDRSRFRLSERAARRGRVHRCPGAIGRRPAGRRGPAARRTDRRGPAPGAGRGGRASATGA